MRDLLGHASLTTTERYDNQRLENLQAAAARLERGETSDPSPREPGSPSICHAVAQPIPNLGDPQPMARGGRNAELTFGLSR